MTPQELEVLRVLCDTFFPCVKVEKDPQGFYCRRGSDLDLREDVARIVASYLAPEQASNFRRLLRTMESRLLNLLLEDRPVRFTSLREDLREGYLLRWAHSRLGVKRHGFHAVKRLVLFLAYAKTLDGGMNPNWPAIGYEPPSVGERARAPRPGLHIEPLRLERETSIETDVCVIGSGAGGAVIAAKLAEAGHRVLVLEAGPYRTEEDFSQLEAEAYETMFQGHGVLTTWDLAFGVLAGQTAGGSTTINWMTCLRPPRWVLEEWETLAGMEGLTSPGFAALLDEIESRLHVTTEESEVNPCNDALRRGCEALGYRLGTDYEIIPRNARGCKARCDFCFFGCIYGAKQSTLVTYLPDAYASGARFLFDTKAERVVVEGGEARGVEATLRSGGSEIPVRVRAEAVLAAGSAIQTPALLLRSGIRFPGVGLGLRLDPTTALLAEHPRPIRMWKGPMQTIAVRRFQDADEGHHGPWLETAPAHPGLVALALPWLGGRSHKEAMRRLPYASSTIVLVRDVAEGRVSIDARGEPVLEYRLTRRDRRNLLLGLREAARIQWAAGATRIATLHLRGCSVGDGTGPIGGRDLDAFFEEISRLGVKENGLALFTAHPMGSARAGRDPRRSAAKPTGECHEVRNLWIGDGSLFPSAPGVNPMISIMALAARTAGHIHARLTGH